MDYFMMRGDDQVLSTIQNVFDATWQIPSISQQLPNTNDDDIASTAEQVMEVSKAKPSNADFQYPFLGSHLLGNISAPPLFASELPSKDMAAPLGDAVQSSSSSVHVTAGMIRIRDMPVRVKGSQLQWSCD
ncbi:NAC domain-containing protein 53 [Bienertia sinuspersici]